MNELGLLLSRQKRKVALGRDPWSQGGQPKALEEFRLPVWLSQHYLPLLLSSTSIQERDVHNVIHLDQVAENMETVHPREVRNENCVFCRIVEGETESHIVFRDESSIAFLDSKPLFPGHCLLTPIVHYETLGYLPGDQVGPLFVNARLIATAVEKAMRADGSFVAINNRVSQSVPHLHIHIVPRRKNDGLRGFFWPRRKYESPQAAEEVQKAIENVIRELVSGKAEGMVAS